MKDWLKEHIEAIVCFALFGLLLITSFYFLSIEGQRVRMEDLAEVRVDESRRDEIIQSRFENITFRRQKAMTAFASKPIIHYDLLLRRNPFKPLEEIEKPPPPPPPPSNGEVVIPPRPPEPPKFEFVVRGIISSRGPDGERVYVSHIENINTNQDYFTRVGEEVEGYKVKEIQSNKVVLVKSDKIIELEYRR